MKTKIKTFLFLLLCACGNDLPKDSQTVNVPSETILFSSFLGSWINLELDTLDNVYLHPNSSDSIELRSLLEESYSFLIYLDINSCLECIKTQFMCLSQSRLNMDYSNVLIITNFSNFRPVYSIMKKFGIEIPMYFTNFNGFYSKKEIVGPLYFVTNSKLIMLKTFDAANWRDTSLMKSYFNDISWKLHSIY